MPQLTLFGYILSPDRLDEAERNEGQDNEDEDDESDSGLDSL